MNICPSLLNLELRYPQYKMILQSITSKIKLCSTKRREITLRHETHYQGQTEEGILFKSLVLHTCNVPRNALPRICQSIGHHFRHSVETLMAILTSSSHMNFKCLWICPSSLNIELWFPQYNNYFTVDHKWHIDNPIDRTSEMRLCVTKKREFTLHQNVQRNLGQSED